MTVNAAPANAIRALDEERFNNAAQASGMQRKVFLAGPFINIHRSPRKSAKNAAALLRFNLFQKLNQQGWIVTLGEYKELVFATHEILGDNNNSALAEIKHAKSTQLDAVVMLPSSPGSFLELGAFASMKAICEKMIIIIDAKYEKDVNYMNTGPIRLANYFGAEVHFIDYNNFEECWSMTHSFLLQRQSSRLIQDILSP